jgi:SAM-dependent MidA family methyltransferase
VPASPDLGGRLERLIAGGGPIPLAAYIGLCNAHYYATRDPLGTAGDFTTAPEISQMFGELIGLWAADLWLRAGQPPLAYAELGPGRGTLAVDALRAMGKAGLAPPVHLVETSPVLRAAQKRVLPAAVHHEDIETLPEDRPLLVVANEFFDALPIRQLVRTEDGWRERMVGWHEGAPAPLADGPRLDAIVPAFAAQAPEGSVLETSPASVAILRGLAGRIARSGGALLAIDYGYAEPAVGDTLQALKSHRFVDPFAAPGEQDLTAHVHFASLARAAREEGLAVHGPVGQGAFLTALGIDARATALARGAPARASEIEAARARLVEAEQMGALFKAIAFTALGWPAPAGFA